MTAIVDTFNRADSSSALGTTSDGSATWTALTGTWGISSNQAYCPSMTLGGITLATLPGGSADGTVQLTYATISPGQVGLGFRMQDSSNFWFVTLNALRKFVAGSSTLVSSLGPLSAGDVIAVVLSGSSITVKQNGSVAATATDSFLSSVAAHGMVAFGDAGGRADSFSFTPPVVVAAKRTITTPRRQALFRAAVR